jgi:hypothetical protein
MPIINISSFQRLLHCYDELHYYLSIPSAITQNTYNQAQLVDAAYTPTDWPGGYAAVTDVHKCAFDSLSFRSPFHQAGAEALSKYS